MPKRKFSDVEGEQIERSGPIKNSLDSDEEDSEDENDQYALEDDDIEGQEEGVATQEEGVQITPFNMKEEMEEGHFDKQGMYHWKKEKVAKDNWLENIDWIKVKKSERLPDETLGTEDDMPEAVDIMAIYKEILKFLLPKENIAKALKRLGGNKSLSASERLKLKKEGRTLELPNNTGEQVTKLTELANKILTHAGNMDIYQETYEFILDKVNASGSKSKVEPELDMYADDFDEKEKERLHDGQPSTGNTDNKQDIEQKDASVVMWEYKTEESSTEIKGPYTSQQMDKWSQNGHFGNGVFVRKCGTERFYTSNRIDFDLYI